MIKLKLIDGRELKFPKAHTWEHVATRIVRVEDDASEQTVFLTADLERVERSLK